MHGADSIEETPVFDTSNLTRCYISVTQQFDMQDDLNTSYFPYKDECTSGTLPVSALCPYPLVPLMETVQS